ncbi:hypothetical protein ABFY57_12165 [Paenibacillus polymyxa]|uniref:hypothetical protein n=1 Tax=Paenibacillus polymyxa TaxID=1406 RepID=UPI003D2AB1F5
MTDGAGELYRISGISYGNSIISEHEVEYEFLIGGSFQKGLNLMNYIELQKSNLKGRNKMSSYETKAINFVTNGPITVRDLSELGLIPDGQTVFPLHFYEMGWGTWLPMSCTLLLPYFSDGIAKGLNTERLISYLNEKVKPDTFILNDKGIFIKNELLVDREVKVKRRLELNGFLYPRNVEEVVQLYLELGLAKRWNEDSNTTMHYDLIIRPLYHIDSILKLK